MTKHARRAFAIVAAVMALVLVVAIPVAAFATSLEDSVTVESHTNPAIGDPKVTWRWSWGNSLHPDMIVTQIPADGTADTRNETLGFIYEVRQIDPFGTGAVLPTWGSASLSPKPEGTWISSVFDIPHVNDVFGWTSYDGAKRGEGMYAITFRFYNQFRTTEATATKVVYMGLDFTNPDAVSNLSASTAGLQIAGGKWTESRWRDLRWDLFPYDGLSGVGGYKVSVNSSDTVFVHNTAPDPAYEFYAPFLLNHGLPSDTTPTIPPIHNVTVEDLPGGHSTISVTVVDRATNESTPSTVAAYVDYDTPTLTILAPTYGATVGKIPTFLVKAADKAGISKVSYYVDTTLVGVSSAAPFSLKPNLSAFANGTHGLRVVAEDQIGFASGTWNVPHTVTKTTKFKLDKTVLTITNFSRTPAIFYPIIRDDYYDNSYIKFKLSKSASVTLTIRNSAGKTVRTIKKSESSGAHSLTWDGKWSSDGKAHTGTYTYQLSAVDAIGTKVTTGKLSTTIRNYQLVRTSNGSVKVIPR